ncbi:hypothetical protein [Cryobacterium sp. 5B3]|uniref:hypothetical protein n=1 Tax=Cryobacterium sp. 5B3 TaxID=3048586 RepID=UPI002AB5CC6C|nr:hypothetical protein [Cryobacterium sp. 5B3]MDY7541838.1 hypothetical protein [Cryobacterium sp. 5B3]MEB0274232.1 hypothetical protein [Cryobacterium sp. 5B3]
MSSNGSPSKNEESEEYRAFAMLLESLRKVDELGDSIQKLRVRPASALAGDDASTPYETLSSQVETNIQGAVDNVRALSSLMLDAKALPAFAHFGLLRGALEMIGTGFWLLGPTSRDTRVLRSLQATLEGRRDSVNASNELARLSVKFPPNDPVQVMLEAQRDARPGLAGRSLGAPSIATRLAAAQEFCSEQPYTILGFWRLTSGATHGRRATLKDLLEHEILESTDTEIRTSMTSGVIVVANILRHVEVYLFDLTFLLLRRAGQG